MPSIFGSTYNKNVIKLNDARRALQADLQALKESSTNTKIKKIRENITSEDYKTINAHRDDLIKRINKLNDFYTTHPIIRFLTTFFSRFSALCKAEKQLGELSKINTEINGRKPKTIPESQPDPSHGNIDLEDSETEDSSEESEDEAKAAGDQSTNNNDVDRNKPKSSSEESESESDSDSERLTRKKRGEPKTLTPQPSATNPLESKDEHKEEDEKGEIKPQPTIKTETVSQVRKHFAQTSESEIRTIGKIQHLTPKNFIELMEMIFEESDRAAVRLIATEAVKQFPSSKSSEDIVQRQKMKTRLTSLSLYKYLKLSSNPELNKEFIMAVLKGYDNPISYLEKIEGYWTVSKAKISNEELLNMLSFINNPQIKREILEAYREANAEDQETILVNIADFQGKSRLREAEQNLKGKDVLQPQDEEKIRDAILGTNEIDMEEIPADPAPEAVHAEALVSEKESNHIDTEPVADGDMFTKGINSEE